MGAKEAVGSVTTNRLLFVHSVLIQRISYSTAHVYHHVLQAQFFLEINAFNVLTIAFSVQQELHVQDVLLHTIIMKESVILTAIRYLFNMMPEEILVFYVPLDVIHVPIIYVILV